MGLDADHGDKAKATGKTGTKANLKELNRYGQIDNEDITQMYRYNFG